MPGPVFSTATLPYGAAALIGGYLLGAIPFGLLLTRLFGMGDIRQVGSGNIGATNVLRTGRKDLALLTLILDCGKGALAAYLGGRFGPEMAVIAALGAFLGHLFPAWLKFSGGKGVATFLGILLVLAFPIGLIACAVWLGTAALFRYSSLAALAAAAAASVAGLVTTDALRSILIILLTALIFVRHQHNIRRLAAGTEPKIGSHEAASQQQL